MTRTPRNANRPAGQTGGSGQRPLHEMEAPALVDLNNDIAALRREAVLRDGDRNAVTLTKEGDLRLVLTVMKSGATLREHRVPGTAAIQAVSGRIRVGLASHRVELGPGQLLTLEANTPHDVEALDEAAFLISIAWPGDPRGESARSP
jgi:quercetin dioxygenase-like cupin family protein